MIVFLPQLQEQHLQHDWYTVSSPTVFCLPLCSYLSTMNKPSREKNHAVARTSEWAVSAVESLSSTQTKKKRKPLCIPGAAGCFTFEILLLEVGPLERARSSFVHHGLVIIPLWDKAMSHCWSATHFMRAECVWNERQGLHLPTLVTLPPTPTPLPQKLIRSWISETHSCSTCEIRAGSSSSSVSRRRGITHSTLWLSLGLCKCVKEASERIGLGLKKKMKKKKL